MLSLRGIPGIYLHSLTATPNDLKAVKETGINRRINRRKWEIKELEAHLDDPVVNFVFGTYARILRRRSDHPAFHPDAGQRVYDVDPELFVHDRTSRDGEERILCCYNFTSGEKRIHNGELSGLLQGGKKAYDILSGKTLSLARKDLVLEPYQARWLVIRD